MRHVWMALAALALTVREPRRLDRLAAVSIEANLTPGQITPGEAVEQLERIAAEKPTPQAQVKDRGENLVHALVGRFTAAPGRLEAELERLEAERGAPNPDESLR